MTKQEALRQNHQEQALVRLGFAREESEQLRRISMTLHRWHELECGTDSQCLVRGRMNGHGFEHDDNGDAYMEVSGRSGPNRFYRVPDREKGALKRLKAIISARNTRVGMNPLAHCTTPPTPRFIEPYIQGDPRGAALYLIRTGDVPEGQDVHGYYTRGVVVY